MQNEYSQTDPPPVPRKSAVVHVCDAAVGPGTIEPAVKKQEVVDSMNSSQAPESTGRTETGSVISTLPPPMSGTASLTTEHRVGPPKVLTAKRLPSPALLFREDGEAVDLSKYADVFTKIQQSSKNNFMAERASVGDSIDLSGLTAEVRVSPK